MSGKSYFLGVSAYYHDSAAALVKGTDIVAAAQEERFTRIKHDKGFPINAIKYCLSEAGINLADVDTVIFYEQPRLKFKRFISTVCKYAPQSFGVYLRSLPEWLITKIWPRQNISRELRSLCKGRSIPPVKFVEHHYSHACSAFFCSPYYESAVLCIDGVGEWATTSAWKGKGENLDKLWEIQYPHSVGLLYSAFTSFLGFKVNSGEYKIMGLAPYGIPKYVDLIKNHLIEINEDGSFKLNMEYFAFHISNKMTNSNFETLFGGGARVPESPITSREMDLAASIQIVVEEILIKLCRALRKEAGSKRICIAGGVALNCVANGKLEEEEIFDSIWIQPAAGDAGGALGAALAFSPKKSFRFKNKDSFSDLMGGSYLGPEYTDTEIRAYLESQGCVFSVKKEYEIYHDTAIAIAGGKIVGWMQGRMEYGPRALGNRSILGDPRNPEIQRMMNIKIKHRESFRPFAPAIQVEYLKDWFDIKIQSPYMLFVSKIKPEKRRHCQADDPSFTMSERLGQMRSDVPAITHIDYSARVQTVDKERNPRFWNLIEEFRKLTGCPIIVNTSFNVRGEPIVCTPEDAYKCFMATEIDCLVLGNYWLDKKKQPEINLNKMFFPLD
ncbi:MAG: hypothetical protein CMO74_12940 [Verrucomicrobiales bacterium]|nr:hypothetical protein [Verrucomicrobiales bacterium]|tara:strand:- start:4680 stop:6518 length:1839 start_codon:yes stop_codon:yes gene_type:complete